MGNDAGRDRKFYENYNRNNNQKNNNSSKM